MSPRRGTKPSSPAAQNAVPNFEPPAPRNAGILRPNAPGRTPRNAKGPVNGPPLAETLFLAQLAPDQTGELCGGRLVGTAALAGPTSARISATKPIPSMMPGRIQGERSGTRSGAEADGSDVKQRKLGGADLTRKPASQSGHIACTLGVQSIDHSCARAAIARARSPVISREAASGSPRTRSSSVNCGAPVAGTSSRYQPRVTST